MRKRVERAQCELLARRQKLAVRAIARHPRYAQRISRRKIEGALHCHANRAARAEDDHLLTARAVGCELRESTVHSGTELRPGFYVSQGKLSVDPTAYYDLEHSLKTPAFLF